VNFVGAGRRRHQQETTDKNESALHGCALLQNGHQVSTSRFDAYIRRKTDAAVSSHLEGFETVRANAGTGEMVAIENAFTRRLFDGSFYRSTGALDDDIPATSLVFVQSLDGNTGADDPASLGGGETDKHLIYEGLSRVDADGVMSGAATAREDELVFSVWHPELATLRAARGRPRHPTQIIVTERGRLDVYRALVFNEPSLRTILLAGTAAVSPLQEKLRDRSWVEVVDAGAPLDAVRAMRELRARGIGVLSVVGGRQTATWLLRAGVVRDIYLTTSAQTGGDPDTPFYEGPPLSPRVVLEKRGRGREAGVKFEHLIVAGITR
jgi:riboflavin biosynthesis pyrimidine reductase